MMYGYYIYVHHIMIITIYVHTVHIYIIRNKIINQLSRAPGDQEVPGILQLQVCWDRGRRVSQTSCTLWLHTVLWSDNERNFEPNKMIQMVVCWTAVERIQMCRAMWTCIWNGKWETSWRTSQLGFPEGFAAKLVTCFDWNARFLEIDVVPFVLFQMRWKLNGNWPALLTLLLMWRVIKRVVRNTSAPEHAMSLFKNLDSSLVRLKFFSCETDSNLIILYMFCQEATDFCITLESKSTSTATHYDWFGMIPLTKHSPFQNNIQHLHSTFFYPIPPLLFILFILSILSLFSLF